LKFFIIIDAIILIKKAVYFFVLKDLEIFFVAKAKISSLKREGDREASHLILCLCP